MRQVVKVFIPEPALGKWWLTLHNASQIRGPWIWNRLRKTVHTPHICTPPQQHSACDLYWLTLHWRCQNFLCGSFWQLLAAVKPFSRGDRYEQLALPAFSPERVITPIPVAQQKGMFSNGKPVSVVSSGM